MSTMENYVPKSGEDLETEGNPEITDRTTSSVTGLLLVVAVSLPLCIDLGIVGVSMETMKERYGVSNSQLGLLAGITYLGISIGSIAYCGPIMKMAQHKRTIQFCLLGSGLFLTPFMFSNANFVVLVVSKFMVGAFQCVIYVWQPIWPDKYAPDGQKALWINIVHISTGLGTFIGITLATMLPKEKFHLAFIPGTMIIFATSATLSFFPESMFNTKPNDLQDFRFILCKHRAEFSNCFAKDLKGMAEIAKDTKWSLASLTLCLANIAVQGLCSWIYVFFDIKFGWDKEQASTVVVVILIVGAGPGTILGSLVVDRLVGGYTGAASNNCLRTCASAMMLAAILLTSFPWPVTKVAVVALAVFGVLFLYFSLPSITGFVLSTPEKEEDKPLAWAMAQSMLNLGWFLGPFLIGIMADMFDVRIGLSLLVGIVLTIGSVLLLSASFIGKIYTEKGVVVIK